MHIRPAQITAAVCLEFLVIFVPEQFICVRVHDGFRRSFTHCVVNASSCKTRCLVMNDFERTH